MAIGVHGEVQDWLVLHGWGAMGTCPVSGQGNGSEDMDTGTQNRGVRSEGGCGERMGWVGLMRGCLQGGMVLLCHLSDHGKECEVSCGKIKVKT